MKQTLAEAMQKLKASIASQAEAGSDSSPPAESAAMSIRSDGKISIAEVIEKAAESKRLRARYS